MSFLPAVQREINRRAANDPVRVTLEFLMHHAIGRQDAVPLARIVSHLTSRGLSLTETGFQQTVLADSRDRDYFIGSGPRGYFLIQTREDAEAMTDFYAERIRAEQQNLENLRSQAAAVACNI